MTSFNNTGSFKIKSRVQAPLDPGFVPFFLANREYRAMAEASGATCTAMVALERENGLVSRRDMLLSTDPGLFGISLDFLERHIKAMLWAYGGWRIIISAPEGFCRRISEIYSGSGTRAFDVEIMGRVYGRPFEVSVAGPADIPGESSAQARLGGHLDGCRIGFDLGASDYKIAAVMDGKPVFSTELPWQPVSQPDVSYHYGKINEGLRLAASHLPRVDAIGGSSAGIIIDSRVRVASLFRAVPAARFEDTVAPIFRRLADEWKVPMVVANDGDVTALAGAMSLGRDAMLGIAMGSSEAAGFLDSAGCITGWLNELAFFPVDHNGSAACDEWSGDRGVGALYFSQQAVNRLLPAAGIRLPAEMTLPDKLKAVQELADSGDSAACSIFTTIGVYLGYTLAHYADYYDYRNVLVLGRVTSGRAGEIIIAQTRDIIRNELPFLDERISIFVPDEKTRRVGQAVAAASLPGTRAS